MRNKKLYLIEDDLDLQFLFEECLREHDFEVLAFDDGLSALSSLRDLDPPDLIVMDLTFPAGTPEDFIETMRSLPGYATVPVILISGRNDVEAYAEKFQSSGFLRKPFDIDEMIEAVKGCT